MVILEDETCLMFNLAYIAKRYVNVCKMTFQSYSSTSTKYVMTSYQLSNVTCNICTFKKLSVPELTHLYMVTSYST